RLAPRTAAGVAGRFCADDRGADQVDRGRPALRRQHPGHRLVLRGRSVAGRRRVHRAIAAQDGRRGIVMKAKWAAFALLLSAAAGAAALKDYARQWPVATQDEGAYAVTLDSTIYQQLVRRDLADLAAFNSDGEALPFGPMPASYAPP